MLLISLLVIMSFPIWLPVLCSPSFVFERFLVTNVAAAHPTDSQLTKMVCYVSLGKNLSANSKNKGVSKSLI